MAKNHKKNNKRVCQGRCNNKDGNPTIVTSKSNVVEKHRLNQLTYSHYSF